MTSSRPRKRSFGGSLGEEADYDSSVPRAGKWSAEEENFAFRLIRDFEAGLLIDCEDGCTLRSYLARKLNCQPMRISKKFAGKCIGKHVFVRRTGGLVTESITFMQEAFGEGPRKKSRQFPVRSESPDYSSLSDSGDDSLTSPEASTDGAFGFYDYDKVIGHPNYPSSRVSGSAVTSNLEQLRSLSYTVLSANPWSSEDKSEAAEWRDVLSFFCSDGSNVDAFSNSNDSPYSSVFV
eukprot:gene40104-48871_t